MTEDKPVVQMSTTHCWCKPVTLDENDVCTTCGTKWEFE